MSIRHSGIVLIASIIAGTSAVGRAQGLDVSLPLERIEDLPVQENQTEEAAATSTLSPADYSAALTARRSASRRELSSIARHVELRIGADIDDDKRYGTYLDAAAKYRPGADGLVTLVPELMVRGDNLSSAAMGTQGLRFDGLLGAVLAPSHVMDNRLRIALVGGGWYMAAQGGDMRGLAIGGKTSIAFCPPILCRDRARDDEQVRVGASFKAPSVGSDSVGIELAYAPQWTYRSAAAMAGTLSPERISATPILQMKNTDTGWSTTVGLDLGIDLTLKINMGVQLRHTLQGGASSVAATQGGLYLSYRPGS